MLKKRKVKYYSRSRYSSKHLGYFDYFINFLKEHIFPFVIFSIIVVIVDFVLKYFAKNKIYNYNLLYGMKFISSEFTFIFVILVFLLILIASFYGLYKNNDFKILIIPLILGSGNVLERLFQGYVTDYLSFSFQPFKSWFGYFNLCDFFISIFLIISAISLILDFFSDFKKRQ